jgi:hypothetical protein
MIRSGFLPEFQSLFPCDSHDGAYAGRASRMNGQIDQRIVLPMLVGCGTVYVAFEQPSFGTALVVGVAVVTLLHLLTRGALTRMPLNFDGTRSGFSTAALVRSPRRANRSRANPVDHRSTGPGPVRGDPRRIKPTGVHIGHTCHSPYERGLAVAV